MDTPGHQPAAKRIQTLFAFELVRGQTVSHSIVTRVARMIDHDDDECLPRDHVQEWLHIAIRRRRGLGKRWLAVIDCDHVDAVFAALEDAGVACRRCDFDEIDARNVEERGRDVHGFTFYDLQVTEGAMEHCRPDLNDGSGERGDNDATKVGIDVASAFRAQGLQVKWIGSLPRRIGIGHDWTRRFPPSAG